MQMDSESSLLAGMGQMAVLRNFYAAHQRLCIFGDGPAFEHFMVVVREIELHFVPICLLDSQTGHVKELTSPDGRYVVIEDLSNVDADFDVVLADGWRHVSFSQLIADAVDVAVTSGALLLLDWEQWVQDEGRAWYCSRTFWREGE